MVLKATVESGRTVTLSETMKALAPAKPPFGRLKAISPPDKFKFVPVNGAEGNEQEVTSQADKTTIVKM